MLPNAPQRDRELATDLVAATLSQVGKRFSETPHSAAEIEAYADAMADMFHAYLTSLKRG